MEENGMENLSNTSNKLFPQEMLRKCRKIWLLAASLVRVLSLFTRSLTLSSPLLHHRRLNSPQVLLLLSLLPPPGDRVTFSVVRDQFSAAPPLTQSRPSIHSSQLPESDDYPSESSSPSPSPSMAADELSEVANIHEQNESPGDKETSGRQRLVVTMRVLTVAYGICCVYCEKWHDLRREKQQ